MTPLFARLSQETARTYGLVLTSAGIPGRTHHRLGLWAISVSPQHRQPALKAIRLYLSENPVTQSKANALAGIAVRTYSALYVAPLLALIHWAIAPGYEHKIFVDSFGADSQRIVTGEVYRCVTALLLHKDWSHVVNNMAGILLFGTVAASSGGWGMGWLMILLSGSLGNLLTALWYRQGHLAIGASTAVFGALGICVALNLWRHAGDHRSGWRMWLPLAAGLALLGFLGGSPHSDLMAHLSGFGCGVAIGGVIGWRQPRPWGFVIQLSAALLAGAMIAASWVWGMHAVH